MDEFRFWKGGFWKSHLGGKPYHISALYLIDLQKFRRLAAGDQYRVRCMNAVSYPHIECQVLRYLCIAGWYGMA